MASRKGVLVLFLLSAVLLPLHQVRGQGYSVDELKPELIDPAWTALNAALTDLGNYQADYISILKSGVVFAVAAYDALAVYSEEMDGLVVGGTLRRPMEEHTVENKRTAMAYATYVVLGSVYGDLASMVFESAFTSLKLDMNDTSMDPGTAVGMGTIIGNAVYESQFNDFNEPASPPSRRRRGGVAMEWRDYIPKNTPYKLKYKTRWQPQPFALNNELYAQVFYAAKLARRPLVTGYHPSYFKVPKPTATLDLESPGYRAQADRVLAISAALNDTAKMLAEGIDGGFSGDGFNFLVNKYSWGLDKQVVWNMVVTMSSRETIIAGSYWKKRFDTVRPFSVIQSSGLYDTVTAWAGPGMGIAEIKASDFRQYNTRTDPSPEYPSGACTKYGALEVLATRFLGTEDFGWSRTFFPGSSQVEPGLTPQEPVVFNFPTFKSLSEAAMAGREFGLVHFEFGTKQGILLGHKVGEELHRALSAVLKTDRLA